MIGLILVTHGSFGRALLDVAESILGPNQDCAVVEVDVTRSMDLMLSEIATCVKTADRGDGVLILTDMFGGTPTNLSLSLLAMARIEVMTGVNLPMLLKVLTMRDESLGKVATEAKNAGKQGIQVAGEVLRRKVET
ncbi:MAG: PTS sugar transporter subunit IIA [Deltaproteobacteria bacterium]|nr:PTS sugar transporter subunit IIA [Deltaproteobacteria bacterium]